MSVFSAIHIFRNMHLIAHRKKMILIVMQPIVFNGGFPTHVGVFLRINAKN